MQVTEERLDHKNTFLRNLLIYTILFAVTAAGAYIQFLYFGRTLLVNGAGNIDGWAQHYPIYVQVKQTITEMMNGQGFCFWAWDFGLGDDIWMLLKGKFLDPLTYIVIAFPVEKIDIGYCVMAVVRQYLTGISFIAFARYIRFSRMQIIFGALCYAFSGWAIEATDTQGTFATAMILFPLLVLGVDKLLKDHSPWLFSISVALLLIYSTLWAYISGIVIFLYFVVRYFHYRKPAVKDFLCHFASFIAFGVLGFLLSAFSFLQTFIKTTGATTESTVEDSMLYSIQSYLRIPADLFTLSNVTTGFSQIFLAGVLLVFLPVAILNIRKKSTAAIMMTVFLVASLFPLTGRIFNGLSYTTGRWYFVLTFFMVWATAECLTRDTLKKKRNLILMALFIAAVCVWAVGGCYEYLAIVPGVTAVNAAIGGTISLLAIAVYAIRERLFDLKRWRTVCTCMLTALLIANVVLVVNMKMIPGLGEEIYRYQEAGKTYTDYQGSCQRVAKEVQANDTSFFRSERIAETKVPPNKNIFHDMRSIYTYFSTIKKSWHEYNKVMGNNCGYFDRTTSFSNGNRVGMDTLMGVKYYFIDPSDSGRNQEEYVPFGYEYVETTVDGIKIYKNKYSIGMGEAYDGYITESELMAYPYLEREQAILQAAVVPDDAAKQLKGIRHFNPEEIETRVDEVDYEIAGTKDIELDGTDFTCKSEEGAITISIPEVKDCELFIAFDNLTREKCSYDEYLALSGNKSKATNSKSRYLKEQGFEDDQRFKIEARKNGIKKLVSCRKGKNQGFGDVVDFYINLGDFDTISGDIEVGFDNVGHYSFDALHVYAVPLDLYEKSAKKLVANQLEIDSFDHDKITGSVDAKTDSMVYMSILGTPGWSVNIDGKRIDKMDDVNISFIGFPVSAGNHQIEMNYESPGLKKGMIISVAGLAILLCLAVGNCVLVRRRKRNINKF